MNSGTKQLLTVVGVMGLAIGGAAACTPEAKAPSKVTEPTPDPVKTGGPISYGDGTYLIGHDMPAGTYRTPGPDKDDVIPNCFWQRAKDSSGELNSIITNGIGDGPAIVTFKAEEFVTFNGDCQWTVQGRA